MLMIFMTFLDLSLLVLNNICQSFGLYDLYVRAAFFKLSVLNPLMDQT